MDDNTKNNIYITIIEYKRSIGTMQWTVMSIFITASEAILAFSINNNTLTAIFLRILSLLIYWFGFFLFLRYRALNDQVAKYLRKLEGEIGYNFQSHLDENFHKKGLPTKYMLLIFGIIYSIFALAISLN